MIATSIALGLIAASATTAGSIAAAKIGSNASSKASKLATESANYSADAQTKANAEALAFQKQQAQNDWRTQEVTRQGNYDQWAAQRRRLGTLGQMMGLPGPEIPAYVATPNPNYLEAAAGSGWAPKGAPAGDLSGAEAEFNELFPGETLTPDMVKAKEKELAAAGFTLRPNAKGTVGKIQYQNGPIIDIIQGADSGLNRKQWLLPSAAAPASAGTLGAMAKSAPMQTPYSPLTPALAAPVVQYKPRTLYDYAGA